MIVIRSIEIVVLLLGAIVTFYSFEMLPSVLGYFLYVIYTDSTYQIYIYILTHTDSIIF